MLNGEDLNGEGLGGKKADAQPGEVADEQLYGEMATEEPMLGVDDEGGGKGKGVTEAEDDASIHSDLKVAVDKLFPPGLGNNITNALMVARVSPDAFVPLMRMMVKQEIARTDPMEEINVPVLMAKYYILLSIPLDGKGRIDILEMAGATKDEEELKKLGKSLGFS